MWTLPQAFSRLKGTALLNWRDWSDLPGTEIRFCAQDCPLGASLECWAGTGKDYPKRSMPGGILCHPATFAIFSWDKKWR